MLGINLDIKLASRVNAFSPYSVTNDRQQPTASSRSLQRIDIVLRKLSIIIISWFIRKR